MELIKHIIGQETVYISKLESANNNDNYFLLGFKDSLPVLSSKMYSLPDVNKTVKIEVSKTGGKFITVNGKRIKILAKSELPKNGQIVKIASLQPTVKTPVKLKILKKLPESNFKILNGFTESKLPNLSNLKIFDKQITSEITAKVRLLQNKIVKVPNSNVQCRELNATDKCINTDSLKIIKREYKGGKQLTENSMPSNNFINGKKSAHPAALDLTKSSENKVKVMKEDKCLQVEINTCDKEIQTDAIEDDFASILNMDFQDLLNEPISTPTRVDTLDNIDILNSLNTTAQKSFESLDFESRQKNTKEENFFKELRRALQVDDKGNMPIHVGVLTNDLKLVKRSCFILKILKQNVNICNNDELTPLQLAILSDSSVDIIINLLQNGASIGVTDSEGNGVLHYAVEHERTEALKVLLNYVTQQRLDIDQHNNAGLTPLMISCLNNFHDCAELLLDADADPNVRDQISGRTSLFHAAELHDVDMVEMLLQFNACTKIKNFFGTSPHDAMYEIEDVPDAIKFMILGKNNKRRSNTESIDTRPTKFQKKIENNRKVLKTYARLEKIRYTDTKTNLAHIST